jgi:hypothetical protein
MILVPRTELLDKIPQLCPCDLIGYGEYFWNLVTGLGGVVGNVTS